VVNRIERACLRDRFGVVDRSHVASRLASAGRRSSRLAVRRYELAGVCAPGVSRPCAIGRAGELMRETIDRRAWVDVLEQVAAGGVDGLVVLTTSHKGGRYLASTGVGNLRLRVDPQLGLMFAADVVEDGYADRVIRRQAEETGVPVSLQFRVVDAAVVRWSNGPCRVVRAMGLQHVALVGVDVDQAGRRPAYPGARCFAGPVGAEKRLLDRARSWGLANGFGLV